MGNEGISIIPDDVFERVESYLKEKLPQYSLIDIRRKSNHPDDFHLYQVIAKKNISDVSKMLGMGEFAVWTCWDDKKEELYNGHYDIKNIDEANRICDKFYHRAY